METNNNKSHESQIDFHPTNQFIINKIHNLHGLLSHNNGPTKKIRITIFQIQSNKFAFSCRFRSPVSLHSLGTSTHSLRYFSQPCAIVMSSPLLSLAFITLHCAKTLTLTLISKRLTAKIRSRLT